MKCPHCNYKQGWDPVEMEDIFGGEGDFYCISNNIKMVRFDHNPIDLFGCPKCKKTFIR